MNVACKHDNTWYRPKLWKLLRSLLKVYMSDVNKTTQTLQSFPPDEFLSFFNVSETWVAPEHKTCSGQLLWKDSDLGENVF